MKCAVAENEEEHQANCVNTKPEEVRYQPRFLCLPRSNRPPPGPLPPITPRPAPRHSGDRPHMPAGIYLFIQVTGVATVK